MKASTGYENYKTEPQNLDGDLGQMMRKLECVLRNVEIMFILIRYVD